LRLSAAANQLPSPAARRGPIAAFREHRPRRASAG
jgi:hypothetical protein